MRQRITVGRAVKVGAVDERLGRSVANSVANDVWSIDSGFGDTKAQTEEVDAKGSRESQGYGPGSGVGA